MKYKSSSSRSQKQKSHRRKSRSSRRSHKRSQRGGSILSPSLLSNSSNSHFAGKGFTDPQGAVTGCTGPPNSADALKGTNIDTIVGGIRMPVMKGGRRRSYSKRYRGGRGRGMKGGSHNTNGYSIGNVDLKPSLSGIANNYHTAYDSCRG